VPRTCHFIIILPADSNARDAERRVQKDKYSYDSLVFVPADNYQTTAERAPMWLTAIWRYCRLLNNFELCFSYLCFGFGRQFSAP
jgi:hypothetical protein